MTGAGRIIGLPIGDATSPPASCTLLDPTHDPRPWIAGPGIGDVPASSTCRNLRPHDTPDPSCVCGYRLVTDLDRLIGYEQARHPNRFHWGANRPKTDAELAQPEHRVILFGTIANLTTRTLSRALASDPSATLRTRQYRAIHAYLRGRDSHLAEPITTHHGIPVTVLDGDDFALIHHL